MTKLWVCHVEFFLSTFIWADISKRCPLCVWEAISDVAGQVCLNDQATKAWFTSTRGVYHTQSSSSYEIWKVLCRTDESPLSVVNVGLGWDHLVPRYSVRWPSCALALIRRFCWVSEWRWHYFHPPERPPLDPALNQCLLWWRNSGKLWNDLN